MDTGVSVATGNAGTERYKQTLVRIAERKECPFCIENLRKEHPDGPLRTGRHWYLIRNQFAYKESQQHFVLISLVHTENLSDLTPDAFREALEFFQWVQAEFGIPAGGIAMRFGEPKKTGATVNHLHFHVIQPFDPTTPGYAPARFRIGGRP